MLNRDAVKYVAKLANLPLSENEEETFASQLTKILDYISLLNEVDTKNVEPTYNTSPNNNITQEDIPSKSLTQEEALLNSSTKKDGFFVTKGVFSED